MTAWKRLEKRQKKKEEVREVLRMNEEEKRGHVRQKKRRD